MPSKRSEARSEDLVWIDAGGGYSLALDGKKLVCRNAKGVRLSSVPPAVKDGEVAEQLKGLVDWLAMHGRECVETVETWMLRSLPVPRAVLESVWADAAWRSALENAVVAPVDDDGLWDAGAAGFFRGVDPDRGIGLVTLDGETVWVDAPLAVIPHPILLAELSDFRELATELGITQGISQLFRETWPKPELPPAATSLDAYADAKFDQLNHALGRARTLGHRIRGGWATCPVWENGRIVEARFWIGSDYPENEAYTGELSWVDDKERSIKISEVGPVAFSEGNRMASLIHAGRAIPKTEDGVEAPATKAVPAPAPPTKTVQPSALGSADVLAAGGLTLPEVTAPKALPVDRVGARDYRHRALGDRVVVRVTADVLAPGEDRVMEFLGFDNPGERPGIALQRRRALGFPGWALVNDPDHAAFALEVVKEFKKHARRAASKPGFAKEGFDAIGERLGRSVPHFLPSYYEEVGRAFIDAGSASFAAQAFNKAREAERVHALAIDEDQRRQAFIDFALAGALTVKAISAYAKDLEKGHGSDIAYRHFRELCLRRTLGGLPPWGGMAKDLRSLSKAAKLDVETEDILLLEELLQAPAVSRAPADFWTAYRKQLVKLAGANANIRETLLNLMPGTDLDETFHGEWIELLDACGATDALTKPSQGVDAAEWFARALAHVIGRGYRRRKAPIQLFSLLRRMADRLKADAVPVTLCTDKWNSLVYDIDLLDLALELGVPVADPAPKSVLTQVVLGIESWVATRNDAARHRDPIHLAADERFSRLLEPAVNTVVQDNAFKEAARSMKGLEAARRLWFEKRLSDLRDGLLPAFTSGLYRLISALSPEVLAEFPDLLPKLREIDDVGALTRTIRAGMLDELGWPALDEAVDELSAGGAANVYFSGAFPYVVVTNLRRAIAVGAQGRLLEHELRVPHGTHPVRLRYADGQMLVVFRDQKWTVQAYWSGDPGDIFAAGWYSQGLEIANLVSVALDGGGVTDGVQAFRAGDKDLKFNAVGVVSDGRTFWCRDWSDSRGLREFDPNTGEKGRGSFPAFFEDFAADGREIPSAQCWLYPLPAGCDESPFGSKDGLAGWRVRHRTDEATSGPVIECEGIDGRRWDEVLPDGQTPVGLARFPAHDALRPVSINHHGVSVWEPTTKSASATATINQRTPAYARGTDVVLPLPCWHFLRPRDDAGSHALRSTTDDAARAILDAARDAFTKDDKGAAAFLKAKECVETAFPAVTHPRVRAGLAGLAVIAAEVSKLLAATIQKSSDAENTAGQTLPVAVNEPEIVAAIASMTETIGYFYGETACTVQQIFETAQFFEAPDDETPQERRVPVAVTNQLWERLAPMLGGLAYLAVAETTPPNQREALLGLLDLLSHLPFADRDHHMRYWYGPYRELITSAPVAYGESKQWLWAEGSHRYLVKTAYRWDSGQNIRFMWALEYAPDGEFKAPKEMDVVAFEPCARASLRGKDRIAAFVSLARERGAVAWDPAIGVELARRTGLTSAAASLLWLGCPRFDRYEDNFLPKELRTNLGLKVAEAVAARNELRSAFGRSVPPWLISVYDEAMRDEQSIWTPLGSGPEDDESPVARFARAWIARVGKRIPIPAELVVAATKDLSGSSLAPSEALALVAQPAKDSRLTTDEIWYVNAASRLSKKIETTDSQPITASTSENKDKDEDEDKLEDKPQDNLQDEFVDEDDEGDDEYDDDDDETTAEKEGFTGAIVTSAAHYIPYLYATLPVGDPLRANLPEMFALVRARLANPNLVFELGSFNFQDLDAAKCVARIQAFASAFGGDVYTQEGVPATDIAVARDTGEVIVQMSHSSHWGQVTLYIRPARLHSYDMIKKLTAPSGWAYCSITPLAHHCELIASAGYTAMIDRIQNTPVPEGQWEANPLYATPDLVAEVAATCGVSEDGAVLYLQTLALAEPTSKGVQTWNGWTAARYKKASTEIAAAGLVLEAKRERAGRAHFLPGGWIPFKSPDLPMEAWKLSMYGIGDKKAGYAKPLRRILPIRPLHELFAEAWDRVKRGDKPEYEEV